MRQKETTEKKKRWRVIKRDKIGRKTDRDTYYR